MTTTECYTTTAEEEDEEYEPHPEITRVPSRQQLSQMAADKEAFGLSRVHVEESQEIIVHFVLTINHGVLEFKHNQHTIYSIHLRSSEENNF